MYNQYMYDDERVINPRVGEIVLYTVHKGDNVYRIAKTLNSEVAWIQVMNQLNDDLLIHPQQELLVPIVYQKVPPMPQPTAMNQNLGGVGQPGAMAEMNINPQMNMMNQMANNGNNGTVPPAQGGMNTTSAPSSTPAPKKNIINMLVPIVAIIIVIFIAFFLLNYFGIIGGKSLTCTATLDDEAGLGMSASSTISAKIKDDKILSADYDMTLNYEPDSLIGASIQMDEETFRESMRESYPGAAIEITDSQVKISGTAKTDDELDGLDMSKNMSEDEFRTFCESSGGTVK